MASKAIGFLNFKFSADLTSFERAMNKAQKKLTKFGKNIQKTGKSLTMGLTVPIVGLGIASLKAFDEQQKAIAQVEAGLKSTGNMVGFTSKKLQEMAADLQTKTLFGDEEILQGATAQLLTFTNIAGDQFAKTQEIALDLATRLDGDLKSASIMLGKALNDPIANLSALSRAGIQFSEDQKSTIKSLVETNQLADAQNIILKELEKQYGGSAEAAAQAGMGPMKQLMNQLSDLSEEIGLRLMPFVKSFTEWILKLAKKFDGLSESTKDSIVKWGLILAAIGPVLIIVGKMSIGIGALIGGFKKLTVFLAANPWVVAAAAIAAVGVAVYNLFKGTEALTSAQDDLKGITKTAEAAIMDQKIEVELLTKELQAQGLTLGDKEEALKKLQKISPEYYGGLDTATLSVEALNQATKDYTASLLSQAKMEASKQKLIDLNTQLLDLENDWLDEREKARKADFFGMGEEMIEGLDEGYHAEERNIQRRISSLASEYTALKKNTKAKEEYMDAGTVIEGEGFFTWSNIEKATKEAMDKKKDDKPTGKTIKKLKLVEILTKKYANTISGLGEKISDLTHVYNNAEKGTDDFNTSSELLLETQKKLDDITEKVAVDTRSPFEIDIEKLERNHQLALNELKDTQLTEQKSADDFNKILENEEMMHLVKMKGLYQVYGEDVVDLDTQIVDALLANQEVLEEDPFANYRGSLGKLGETIAEFTDTDLAKLEEGLMSIAEKIGDELAQGADSFQEYADNIKGMIKDIIGAIISQGIAAAVTNAISGSPLLLANPWLIPIIAGAAAGLAKTAFNSLIPEFAQGGIVTGPTTALIGEAGPEAVIPLDRLNQYTGGQNVTVTGRLVGTDIYLSNERTKFNRNRTV